MAKTREEYREFPDHDLLIELNVKMDMMDKQFSNHLHHHWMITMAAISAALTGGIGFVTSLILLFIKSGVIK